MMDCDTYRRTLMSNPHDADAPLIAHRGDCHDCNLFAQRLLRFEERLERAMRVPAPEREAAPTPPGRVVPLRTPTHGSRWLAMAASVLLAVVVAGGLWLSVSRPSLAADVVTHMKGEPEAWRRTDVPVPAAQLQSVLDGSHLRLADSAGLVSYASSCEFRGHHVPHLVVQTAAGPVTVMVLVHEAAKQLKPFEEQGYRGVIVPVPGHGSLAVLTQGASADMPTVERIASRVQASIIWTRG